MPASNCKRGVSERWKTTAARAATGTPALTYAGAQNSLLKGHFWQQLGQPLPA